MSADPTPNPPPAPPSDAPFADAVAANRPQIGWALVAAGLVCLGLAVFLIAKPLTGRPPAPADQPDARPSHPLLTDYVLGGVAAVFGGLALAGVGGSLLAAVPKVDPAARRAEARTAVLYAGGMFGGVLMLAGLAFFVLYFASINKWLVDGKATEARFVLAPLLAVLVGGGLVFAAAQPARAEERNNPTLRRLVYGANLGLTALLLVVLLVVGNVIAGTRLTGDIDTTEGGHYTVELSKETREFLRDKLTEPVTIYSTVQEDNYQGERRLYAEDTHKLLNEFRNANPAKVTVKELSATLNTETIAQLRRDFPGVPLQNPGLLVVAGDKRHGFVRFDELFTREDEATVYRGESRLVQEILLLGEGGAKPVVYFTQGSGELALTGGDPERSAAGLRTALEQNNVTVKGWNPADAPPGTPPAVPDDAAVLAVMDPTTPLKPEVAAAIGKYVTQVRPGTTKKGKLVVASGARPGPTGGVNPTGLEGVLAGLGLKLGEKFLYGAPTAIQGQEVYFPIVVPTAEAVEARNPVALAWVRGDGRTPIPTLIAAARTVEATGATEGQIERLLVTVPEMPTWQETDQLPEPPEREWDGLTLLQPGETQQKGIERLTQVRARKLFGGNRVVAAAVREGDTNRAVVFGYGEGFAPAGGRTILGGPPQPRVLATAVDWLRDRPAAATIPPKRYGIYTPNPTADPVRLLLLPGVVAALSILATGIGVWSLRRK